MAEAIEVQIAKAIVAELNDPARGWSMEFVADRDWAPQVKPEDLGEAVKVSVVVPEIEQEQFSRDRDVLRYAAGIAIQQRVPARREDLNAACDDLTRLAEAVHDFYRAEHALATLATYQVIDAQRPEVYDLQRLNVESVFETLIVVTVEGYKT